MAKKKKLTVKELEALHAILNAKRENEGKILNITSSIRNLKAMREESYKAIEGNNNALDKLRDTWKEKYGDVNINTQTGEFVDPPAEE